MILVLYFIIGMLVAHVLVSLWFGRNDKRDYLAAIDVLDARHQAERAQLHAREQKLMAAAFSLSDRPAGATLRPERIVEDKPRRPTVPQGRPRVGS